MSTRCNIIVKDGRDELIFYRHSDGYPEGAMPTLETFLALVKEGKVRSNVSQAAGWLILLGGQIRHLERKGNCLTTPSLGARPRRRNCGSDRS